MRENEKLKTAKQVFRTSHLASRNKLISVLHVHGVTKNVYERFAANR